MITRRRLLLLLRKAFVISRNYKLSVAFHHFHHNSKLLPSDQTYLNMTAEAKSAERQLFALLFSGALTLVRYSLMTWMK